MRVDSHLSSGSQNRLTGGGGNRPGVHHVLAHQHDAAAISVGADRAAQNRSALHNHVTGRSGRRKQKLICTSRRLIQQPPLDQIVIDRQAGGHQGPGVDLAVASEDHAVLVDDVNLAVRRDSSADLGRCLGSEDAVEGDPLCGIRPAGALIES